MDRTLTEKHKYELQCVINIDYDMMKKKVHMNELDKNIKCIHTYNDLHTFLKKYEKHMSFLCCMQLEMIIKDIQWDSTLYTVIAVTRFKKLLKRRKTRKLHS